MAERKLSLHEILGWFLSSRTGPQPSLSTTPSIISIHVIVAPSPNAILSIALLLTLQLRPDLDGDVYNASMVGGSIDRFVQNLIVALVRVEDRFSDLERMTVFSADHSSFKFIVTGRLVFQHLRV
jgi:hypothetical protein